MLKRFFGFVEISTKLASLFPFLLGLVLTIKLYGAANWVNTAIFFASMLLFDMTATAINNYIDTRTNGRPLQFSRPVGLTIILVMLSLAVALGLWLTLRTDLVVLVAGAACFAVGIFYTFGPAPISRMPLGEIFSGLFMGFFIPFLVLQVNAPAGSLVNIVLDAQLVNVSLRWPDLLLLVLWTVTPMATIANIMLANNICDVEHDVAVSRLTLPYYIGKAWSLKLFATLYALSFISWITLVALGQLSPWTLALLILIVPVVQNLRVFFDRQIKSETFPICLKIFLLQNAALLVAALVSIWL